MTPVGDVDHVIHLVRDLDAADAAMARLGFRTTPRGLHSEAMGTANSTIVFRDRTYVELLAVLRKTPLNEGLVAELEQREGPAGIAFKTGDARAAAEAFAAAGVDAGSATGFSRPVELPGGSRDASFTIARIDPAATPGAWSFVCQHHSPDVVWREDHLDHPNGARGLLEVVGVAADLALLAEGWRRVLGERLRHDRDEVVVRTGTATLRFLSPLASAARFGRLPRTRDPHLDVLVFGSADLDRTRAVLREQGVRTATGVEGGVVVGPDAAAGAVIEFRQAG